MMILSLEMICEQRMCFEGFNLRTTNGNDLRTTNVFSFHVVLSTLVKHMNIKNGFKAEQMMPTCMHAHTETYKTYNITLSSLFFFVIAHI